MISTELLAHILRLHTQEKWTVHAIAKHLRLHHSTVRRALAKGAIPATSRARPSLSDPFVPFIKQSLERYPGLSAARLYQMVRERGYPGCAGHFRAIVARHRPKPAAEAYLRLQTLPGEQAQVDWAYFGKHQTGAASRSLWAFVMVLSDSRMLFVRFFLGQTQSLFLQGHQHAFAFFGGVPRVLLYDNLKSAVLERQGDAIRFHPLLWDFATYYGYEPRPVAVARGNEKGRVERAIRYLRTSFFPARPFTDLQDLNAQALLFCQQEAAQRRCPQDPTLTVRAAWEKERPLLLPLREPPYPTDERVEVRVGKTPYVRFDKNDYSVPHTAVRRTLCVFSSDQTIRILDGQTEVAVHPRCLDQGKTVENPAHIEALRTQKQQAHEPATLRRLCLAAPAAEAFVRRLATRGGALGPAIVRLERLLDLFGPAALQAALSDALSLPTTDVHAVQVLLDQRKRQLALPPPIGPWVPEDSPLRKLQVTPHPLAAYDALCSNKEAPDAPG
ncbi:MAG TPA: IS21 family transposase [Pseudomonadota bacterium]|nr:IS21 family transposase [Pseudomonadota bacterium]